MWKQEIDKKLRELTEREKYHREHPNKISPSYKTFKTKVVKGQLLYCFEVPHVRQTEIEIRKDSRFTSVPPHVHSNISIHFIYSGSCTYIIDDREITLKQNDVCIFDTDVIRSKKEIGENDIVINICLSNGFFSNYFLSRLIQQSILSEFILTAISDTPDHDNYLIFNTQNSTKIRGLFINVLSEYYDKNLYSRELIDSYIEIVFVELLRVFHSDKNNQIIQLSGDQSNELINIISYIEKNFLTCNLVSLAERFNYHPKYLSHLIKEKTGRTFKEIQFSQRMRVAATYLLNSSYTVHDIAERVGFYNKKSFYDKFKIHFGMTPKQYRDKNQYSHG